LDEMKEIGRDQDRIRNAFEMERVSTRTGGNHRIDEVMFNMTPLSSFSQRVKGGGEKSITFRDYFEQKHNISIREMNQPLFKSIQVNVFSGNF